MITSHYFQPYPMTKKKSNPPKASPAKAKSPRAKRLRLIDHSPLNLTDAQRQEVRELYHPLAHISGLPGVWRYPAGLRRIAFDRLLYLYVEALCCDAGAENAGQRRDRTTSLRRQAVAQLSKLSGRDLSPDDIVKALSKHAPAPRFLANVIRRDYLRCTV